MLAQLSLHEGQSVKNIPAPVQEMFRFLSDMQATFRGEKHGVVGHWQYSSSHYAGDPVKGAALWESFLNSPNDYYLLPNEIRLIQEKAGYLLSNIEGPTVVVDFGQGPAQSVQNKTVPVMRHLKNIAAYCPIDMCKDYILEASDVINREWPNLPLKGYHVNYFHDRIKIPKTGKPLGLFFGGTLGNVDGHPDNGLPENVIIEHLRTMKEILGENAFFIMANDTNQDEISILQSYKHKLQMAFGSNLMYRIKRDLPVYGNFDPEAWHYEPVWHAQTYQICHTVVCDKDQSFLLGNERFNIRRGESFILNNSYKFPTEKIKEWSAKAGFLHRQHVMDHENRMALHVLTT